jgi:hypothetical protein
VKGLALSREFRLPLDVAGETIAILAKKGAGKTNTATVLVEELVAAGVQVVIVSPVPAWWGIRYGADRKSEGLPIPILGGEHGDVPLEPAAGALIADVVVDTRQSILVDLSAFPSKAAANRFVTEFAERLYRRKLRERSPSVLHLVLEEADEFAPQGGKADTARMRGAIEQIVRRGRGSGLGITMITQRSAVLNKDVLTQADTLIALRTVHPNDIEPIRKWVTAKGDLEEGRKVIESLPGLATGEAWVWNPEHDILERVQVRLRHTFDSSKTPRAGQQAIEPGRVAPINLTALGEQIQATAEKAKQDDPRELRKRIHELEQQLARQPVPSEPDVVEKIVEVEKTVEVPAVIDEQLQQLVHAQVASERSLKELHEVVAELGRIVDDVLRARQERARAEQRAKSTGPPVARRSAPPAAATPAPAIAGLDHFNPSGPQQRILDSLAALEAIGISEASKVQLALFAEASPKSSSYTNNLGALRTAGMLDYPAGGRVQLTATGRLIADAGGAPSTVDELHEFVFALVGNARARILRALIDVYPDALAKGELAERIEASASSSSFTNNLGSLRSLGLIDYPAAGMVHALSVLFLEGSV